VQRNLKNPKWTSSFEHSWTPFLVARVVNSCRRSPLHFSPFNGLLIITSLFSFTPLLHQNFFFFFFLKNFFLPFGQFSSSFDLFFLLLLISYLSIVGVNLHILAVDRHCAGNLAGKGLPIRGEEHPRTLGRGGGNRSAEIRGCAIWLLSHINNVHGAGQMAGQGDQEIKKKEREERKKKKEKKKEKEEREREGGRKRKSGSWEMEMKMKKKKEKKI